MCNESSSIDRKRTCYLDGIRQFQPERSAQSCRIFCDVEVESDRLPGFENSPVTPRESIIARLQRPVRTSATVMVVTREAKAALRMRCE